MNHDGMPSRSGQVAVPLGRAMRRHVIGFLEPVGVRLAAKLDIGLLETVLDVVQVIVTHRHGNLGLLLEELGGYLLGSGQAPAGVKPISNLLACEDWWSAGLNPAGDRSL